MGTGAYQAMRRAGWPFPDEATLRRAFPHLSAREVFVRNAAKILEKLKEEGKFNGAVFVLSGDEVQPMHIWMQKMGAYLVCPL
jgi:hypothetical protein